MIKIKSGFSPKFKIILKQVVLFFQVAFIAFSFRFITFEAI